MISPQTKQLRQLRRNIGTNIHEIRKKKKIPLKKLSRLTNISMERLDAFEIGKYDIGLYHMTAISIALNVKISRFL